MKYLWWLTVLLLLIFFFHKPSLQSQKDAVQKMFDLNGGSPDRSLEESIEVENGMIVEVNLCIGFMTSLRVIPPEFGRLVGLREFYLDYSPIESLPEEFCKCRNLTTLAITHSKLKHLPKSIGKLKKLGRLFLNGNELEDLPESIGNLENLYDITLFKNKLKKLPESFCNLTGLFQELDIADNELESLPENMGLMRIKILDFKNNKITSLPLSLEWCPKLKTIYGSNNRIQKFDLRIFNNGNLIRLNLSQNEIKELICDSLEPTRSHVESIYLDYNRILELPVRLFELKTLKSATFDYNKLLTLPDSIIYTPFRGKVSLNNNQICNLKPSILKWLESFAYDSTWVKEQVCQ
jgi:internalin A